MGSWAGGRAIVLKKSVQKTKQTEAGKQQQKKPAKKASSQAGENTQTKNLQTKYMQGVALQ